MDCKFLLVLILLALLSHSLKAQKPSFEQLQNQLERIDPNQSSDQRWESLSVLNQIGEYFITQNVYDSALVYLTKAESIISTVCDLENEQETDVNNRWAIKTYNNLSQAYEEQENVREAIKYAQKELDVGILFYGENSNQLYHSYKRIGDLISIVEEDERSFFYYRKALFVLEKEDKRFPIIEKKNKFLAEGHRQLGTAYRKLGKLEEAKNHYQKGLDFMSDSKEFIPMRILTYLNMSQTIRRYSDEKMSWVTSADSLWEANKEDFSDNIDFQRLKGSIFKWHAYYWKYHRDIEKAIFYFKKGNDQFEKFPKKNTATSDIYTLMQIAEIYGAQAWKHEGAVGAKLADSSIYYTQLGLIRACKTYNSLDPSTLPNVSDFRNVTYAYGIFCQLSRFIEKKSLKFGTKAEQINALNTAIAIIDLADKVHERYMRETVMLRGGKKATLIPRSVMVYNYGLYFCTSLNQLRPSEALVEKAFYYAQRKKAQQLWGAILKNDLHRSEKIPDSLIEHERKILDEIFFFENQLSLAEEEKNIEKVEQYQNINLFELRRAYEALQVKIESDYPVYYNNNHTYTPVSIQTIKNTLKEDEIIIELSRDHSVGYAFVISKEGPFIMKELINDRSEQRIINESIESLNKLLQNSLMARKSSREKFIKLSHRLYQHYIHPFEHNLVGKKRLIIIGDHATNYIPFEVLLKTEEIKPFHELDYLIKDLEISYHYSSTLFVKTREQAKNTRHNNGIYVFAPVYDTETNHQLAFSPKRLERIDTTLRAIDNSGNYVPLPESEMEALTIFQLFENEHAAGNEISLREEATETELKNKLEKPFQFIHIAGHSFANLRNPKLSGIACINTQETTQQDNILYTGEIYNLETQADLITLSSCESGFGKLAASDGLIGLNRAFIYAGTPNVVYSLWKIYDKVTANLMVDFYRNILSGKSYATSLRETKLALINDESTATPHFWSPYLLIGR